MNFLSILKKSGDETCLQLEGITFRIKERAVGHYRLLFFSNVIVLILPFGKNALTFLNKNMRKIRTRYDKFLQDVRRSEQIPLRELSKGEFENLCRALLHGYAGELSLAIPEMRFRKMKRRWGSCRNDGRITLNRSLCHVPERLIAYVIYHEVLHLQIPNHGRSFKQRLQERFPQRKQLDYELKLYGMRLLCDIVYQ